MPEHSNTSIAIVGCGFVADFYIATLANYPWLRVAGVFDIDSERLQVVADFYRLPKYESFEQLLEDDSVSIVVNLTNPRAHYEISRRSLEADRHVYSEKPLAMKFSEAEELVELAEAKGLVISSAPCSLLGNAAQTLWRGVRDSVVGKVRLVYAELDDGMVHQMPYRKWKSISGAPWPYKDEFEVGCTLEHAGYYLSWLIAMFGPVETITAFSACLIPDKVKDGLLDPHDTPDFSVGLLKFENGVVARLSTTLVGPHDHGLKIIGEQGIMGIDDCWFNNAKVYVRKFMTIRRKTFLCPIKLTYRVKGALNVNLKKMGGNRMDFAAGLAELAQSVRDGRPCRLSARFSLHVNEVALALQNAGTSSNTYVTQSRFDPVQPLNWAIK